MWCHYHEYSLSKLFRILGLQPRDQAAMLDEKFFLKNLHENRV